MRHHIRQTHITDELQTGKAAGVAGGFPASGVQYHPLTSAPPRSPASPEPVHDAGVPRVAPQWRHGRQIPGLFLDLTRFNHPKPTISFNSSSEMPVCRQNSVIVKVTVTLAIMLSPIFTWIKRRLGVCQLLPQRGSVFIRFRRHHDFQYRIQIAGLFLLTRPLPLTRNRCPAAARRDSQQNAFFQCWNGDFSTQRRFPRANRHHNFQIPPTISNSGCGAI